jgi:hypothetical protein
VATSVVVGIEVFSFGISRRTHVGRFHTSVESGFVLVSCKSKLIYVRQRGSARALRKNIHQLLVTARAFRSLEIACYLSRMFWRMSLYCEGGCQTHGEEDFIGEDRYLF